MAHYALKLSKHDYCQGQAQKSVDLAFHASQSANPDYVPPKEDTIMNTMRRYFIDSRQQKCGRAYAMIKSFEQGRIASQEQQIIHGFGLYENWHRFWIKDGTFPIDYYRETFRGRESQ